MYPNQCPLCGQVTEFENGVRRDVCRECEDKLSYISGSRCMKCGKQLSDSEEYCYDCSRCEHVYDQSAAVFLYTAAIKSSIYRYKYDNKREYAKWYAKKMYESCRQQLEIWQPELIVPVPLHPKRLKKRGYNQAQLLAQELGRLSKIPVKGDYLLRIHNTLPMKKLSPKERTKNLEKAFILNENSVKYNKIMLVDDIYTTGATFDACAEVLKRNQIQKVYCISLCIGEGI